MRLTVTLFLVQLAEKSKRNSQLCWVTQVFLPHLVQLLLQKVKKVDAWLSAIVYSRATKRRRVDQSVS